MLLPYHKMLLLKSKQTHARLGTLISFSRIERSSPITTIFELAQGSTHPVHIAKCSRSPIQVWCSFRLYKDVANRHYWLSINTWNEQPADKLILLLGKRGWKGGGGGGGQGVGWGN